MTSEELDALVLRLKEGDASVCAAIYRETIGLGWDAARILLRQREDIQDVLQISYAKAFQHIDQLESPANFRAWLRRIILNESKNYLKKQDDIENAGLLRLADLPMKEPQDQQANDLLHRAEMRDLIETSLASLPEDKRRCLELFYYDNLRISEIADLLDIPEGTVKTRLRAAKQELRMMIGSDDDFGPLFSFSLLPLFFAQQAQTASVPAQIAEAVGAHVAATAGSAAAGASGTAAAGAAAASTGAAAAAGTAAGNTAAGAAASGLAMKIAAVTVAGAVAAGGGATVKHQADLRRETAVEPLAAVTETATTEEALTTLLQALSATSKEETATGVSRTTVRSKATTAQNTTASTMAPSTSAATRTQPAAAATTEKRTTVKATTAKATTTKAEKKTTTQKQTTTAKQTTAAKETTAEERTTTRSTAADYQMSGGTLTGYDGDQSSVSIPASVQGASVTAIGAGAFSGNTTMRSVSIPSGVTQIGQEAFSDCTRLSSVSMPSTLDRIGIGAFYGCDSLKSVTIPAGTSAIGDEAFAQCGALKTVKIPSSVTSIADDAFDGCDNLTIQCKAGSAAQTHAEENGIPYELI